MGAQQIAETLRVQVSALSAVSAVEGFLCSSGTRSQLWGGAHLEPGGWLRRSWPDLFWPVAHAQRNQPVYPAYDGFLKNPDGSYTLSFAYFSHNAEPVTIPPGAGNSFTPDPADRQQPTTFRPGHWRFQCVIVVGPEFDGKLRWTLTYAGTTTGTSQNMLHSNYNLVEGAAELRAIDYAKAPRGVCLNRAPIVRVLGLSGAAAARLPPRRSPSARN